MPAVPKIETYSDLQNAAADWLDRTDLSTPVTTFIQFAESDMNRKLRHHKMVKTAQAVGVQDNPKVTLPTDWLEARNVKLDGVQASYQPQDVIDALTEAASEGGCAVLPDDLGPIYTFVDTCLVFFPTPSADYQVDLDYYCKIPPLRDAADGKNWMLIDNPDTYLYGALAASAPYLRDDARTALWSKLYDEGIVLLQAGSEQAMISGSLLSRKVGVRFG